MGSCGAALQCSALPLGVEAAMSLHRPHGAIESSMYALWAHLLPMRPKANAAQQQERDRRPPCRTCVPGPVQAGQVCLVLGLPAGQGILACAGSWVPVNRLTRCLHPSANLATALRLRLHPCGGCIQRLRSGAQACRRSWQMRHARASSGGRPGHRRRSASRPCLRRRSRTWPRRTRAGRGTCCAGQRHGRRCYGYANRPVALYV